ncbi:MAG: SWIM zinc finger family protein [Kiritimatiellae bacterium]|nr:SWIM zinc finger family protein [Kiritimatiellia bacterium]
MSKKNAYAPRFARSVRGGLRPQGGNRDVWWRKRWITWLEEMHLGARLGRGRNYAQQGQVCHMEVAPGIISAEVQGADQQPYQLSAEMPVLDAEKVWDILHDTPIYTAQVAARFLPFALCERLQQHGLLLFPERRQDMTFRCTCKDWSRPCKHLLAVLCLFADAIASDPLLLFRFRGILFSESEPDLTPQVLSPGAILKLHPSPNTASIPRRLGTLPYWRGSEDFRKTLEAAYHRSQLRAVTPPDMPLDLRFAEDMPTE